MSGWPRVEVVALRVSAGFTMVETLIAMTMTITVMGAVFAILVPARRALIADPEAADLHQRARFLVDTLRTDLLMAGAGTGPADGGLGSEIAAVMPYRLGRERSDARAGVHFTSNAMTVLFVPPTGDATTRPVLVGRRTVSVVSRTYYLRPSGDGGQLMRYDGLVSDFPVLEDVVDLGFEYFGEPAPPRLVTEDPRGVPIAPRTTYGPVPPALETDDPADAWAAGENCVFEVRAGRQEPRLAWLATDVSLRALGPAILSDGPWCEGTAPDEPYDADLLRIRRVRVHARLQARAEFRGPVARLFARGGSARSMGQLVPDREVWFDVAPRNLNHGR